jgi:hypothetical protein
MTQPTSNPADSADPADPARAILANAASVIEITRRAWPAAPAIEKPKTARRPMQAGMLIAMNFWSHKAL